MTSVGAITDRRLKAPAVAYAVGLMLVFALALFVRERVWTACGRTAPSYLDWAEQHYYGGISRFYVQWAEKLARGQPYTTLAYPPGYPAFLALLIRSGLTLQHIRVVQFVVDGMAVFATSALLLSLGLTRTWALAGALAYALHPLWATGSVYLLGEAFAPAIVVTFLWSLVKFRNRSPGWAIMPGVIAGAGALVRPDFLLLIVPGLAWFFFVDRRRDRLRAAAIFACSAFAFILLWGAHNKRVHGIWMFGTTASGAGLWEGLGELPNDYGYVLDDSRAAQIAAAHGFRWSTPGASAYFTREYLKGVVAHPDYVARVVLNRWRRITFESEPGVHVFFARVRAVIDSVGVVWLVAAIVIFRRRRDLAFVAAVPLVFAMFSIGLVHYEARYVRYAQLSYLVAGLALLDWLWRRAATLLGERRRVLVAVLGLGVTVYTAHQLMELHRFARTFPSPFARN